MPVTHVLDRIQTGIIDVLETRAAPDDQIDFAASLTLIEIECDDDEEDCCGHHGRATGVSIYIAVSCPEMGQETRSMCHVMVPLSLLSDDEEVAEIGNDLWDRLQSTRLMVGMEIDGVGREDSPDLTD